VDKRKIAVGGRAMEDEMTRLMPAIRAGGFIPSCDHGIPSDVSWANYLHYCRLLAHATGWL
jgi:uroporphyrinogen decarboxylase